MLKSYFFVITLLLVQVAWSANRLASDGLNFDANVPSDIKAQMLQDLQMLYQIQGSAATPLHLQIYGKLDGASYQTFFVNHVQAVGMSTCGDPQAVACVLPWGTPNKMNLTNNFIKFQHPQIARLMVMFHEARHTESKNGNWSHDTCPTPFLNESGQDMVSIWTGAKLQGQPGCDNTEFGSYGSSTILLKNVALHCSNCSDKVKMDADLYATDQLGRIDRAEVKDRMRKDFQQ